MEKTYKLTFDIDKTINIQEISEIHFEATNASEDPTFTIKIRFVDGARTRYNIYLLSSRTVSLRCVICITDNPYTDDNMVSNNEMKNKYFRLETNNWRYVSISSKPILSYKYLHFQYTIIQDEKDLLSMELGNNYSKLLRVGDFTDIVTVKSVEGNEHKVHKALLVSRSEVLKAHFEHDTTESKTNVVESPLENQVLVDVLTFIYCNIVPSIEDIPEKLLAAADYYQLHEMKSLCEEKLIEKLCVDNAPDTLQLADLHSAENLKQFTLEYIKHQILLIMKTEGWAKLESSLLLKDIFKYIVSGDVKFMKLHDPFC